MRVARESRGFSARDPRHWPVLARSAGALFIRSYERGERVHLAMLSRGYTARCRATGRSTDDSRPRRPGRWPTPTPTATRRCTASTCTSTRASGSRCSAPTAPARPRSCCTSTASSPRAPAASRSAGCRSTKENLAEIRRRVGIVFQDPDDQLFMATVREDVALRARPTSGCGAPSSSAGCCDALDAGRHGRVRRPPAAPPLLRPAPPGRGRHGARHGAGDPGARRAVVQPRPGLAPRARRHPAVPGRHRPDGHPRPAVRPRAVPAVGGPLRRRRRRRRPDVRHAGRRRADAGAPAGAARSVSTRGSPAGPSPRSAGGRRRR